MQKKSFTDVLKDYIIFSAFQDNKTDLSHLPDVIPDSLSDEDKAEFKAFYAGYSKALDSCTLIFKATAKKGVLRCQRKALYKAILQCNL